MALTQLQITKLKPDHKRLELADGHGLYLTVQPASGFKFLVPALPAAEGHERPSLTLGSSPAARTRRGRDPPMRRPWARP